MEQVNEKETTTEPKTNGIPKPAPRRLPSQTSTASTEENNRPIINNKMHNQNANNQTTTNNHKKATPSSSVEGDDVQVLPKPITNEEFQAMIPAHFLKHSSNTNPNAQNNAVNNNQNDLNNATCAGNANSVTTVTIKKPDPIELPPAPTGPGRVTETITKSTFTETVVTRITDNQLVAPLIIEV